MVSFSNKINIRIRTTILVRNQGVPSNAKSKSVRSWKWCVWDGGGVVWEAKRRPWGPYEWRPEGRIKKNLPLAHVRGGGPPPPLALVVLLITFYFIYLFILNFIRIGTDFCRYVWTWMELEGTHGRGIYGTMTLSTLLFFFRHYIYIYIYCASCSLFLWNTSWRSDVTMRSEHLCVTITWIGRIWTSNLNEAISQV